MQERAAPGIGVMLRGAGEGGSHSVLDLGSATDSSLQVYSRFARRVRFAGLLADGTLPHGWAAQPSALPAQPDQPYDLVFAWDILDRLFPEERARFVKRLVDVSCPDACLHVVVEATEGPTYPLKFNLVDVDRMECERTGPERAARRRLLPAELERLLEPFHIDRAFTLKSGLREYVAFRDRARVGRHWV